MSRGGKEERNLVPWCHGRPRGETDFWTIWRGGWLERQAREREPLALKKEILCLMSQTVVTSGLYEA